MNDRISRRKILQAATSAAFVSALPRISVAEDSDYLPAVAGSPEPPVSAFGKTSTAEEVTAGLDLTGQTIAISNGMRMH